MVRVFCGAESKDGLKWKNKGPVKVPTFHGQPQIPGSFFLDVNNQDHSKRYLGLPLDSYPFLMTSSDGFYWDIQKKHVRSQVKVYHRQRSKVYHPPIGLLNRQPSQIFLFGYLFFLCTIFGLAFQAPFGNYLLCDERRSPALSNH